MTAAWLIGAVLMLAPTGTPPDDDRQMAEGLAALQTCGIAQPAVRVMSVDANGSVSATIAGPLADQVLVCLEELAARGGPAVELTDPGSAQAMVERQQRRWQAIAEEWLRDRGLLASLPRYDRADGGTAGYARRVERHCHAAEGRLLRAVSDTQLAIATDIDASDGDALQCVMMSLTAGGVESEAISIDLLGDQAGLAEQPVDPRR